MFKMASPPVTWMPTLYYWCTKDQRSLHFTKVALLQLQHDWSLCSLCFSRDLTAGDGRYINRVIQQAVYLHIACTHRVLPGCNRTHLCPHHGVCFTRPCLPICKDTGIVALKGRVQHWCSKIAEYLQWE